MDNLNNVPVVANEGDIHRVVGAADFNYETGEVTMHLGVDVLAVLEGSYGSSLHFMGVYFRGTNTSEQPMEMRRDAWQNMLSRKEEFEMANEETGETDG